MDAIKPDAVVIGVDTHKDVHVAVAITALGARLDATSIPATSHGYRQLADWRAPMDWCTPSALRARARTEPVCAER